MSKETKVYDSKIPGLYIRNQGEKAFYYLRYRFNGVQRHPKIGDANVMSKVQAQEIARDMLFQVAQGIDPSFERQMMRAERSVHTLFLDCYEKHWSKLSKNDWVKEVKRLYEKEIKNTFGHRKLSDIRVVEIRNWHSHYADSNPYVGNRALAVLSKLYSYAETKEWRAVNTNPCKLIKNHKEEKRDRYATAQEICAIGKVLRREFAAQPKEVTFICLLLLTGARPSAIERARREDMEVMIYQDQEFGIIKFDGKTGTETLTLPPQALQLIYNLSTDDEGTLTGTDLVKVGRFWRGIRAEVGVEDLWLRDFRRTFATIGMSGGTGMALISELLNHKSQQTTMLYAKLIVDNRLQAVSSIAGTIGELLK